MATDIKTRFLDEGRQIGSVFLLPPDAAIRMIQCCRANGIDVLGVEGFCIFDDKIQPLQEHTLDFDDEIPRPFHVVDNRIIPSKEYGHDFDRNAAQHHERLVRFLTQRLKTDLWFEIVAGE